MGKYFTTDEFRTKFRELLEAKRESDKYSDAEIMQIHQHLFGANENKELIYLIPEYFLEAAKDIKEKKAPEFYPKIIIDSKIYDSDELFSTPSHLDKNGKEFIFVLTQNNELLIEEAEKNRGKQDRMNHSSLAGHKPVKMAGTIHVETGIVKTITNASGHFMPSKENFVQFLKEYVNIQKLTLCSENFKAKYIANDSDIVGDTELEPVSSEEIVSCLPDCPREKVQSSHSRRLGRAKRGLSFGNPEGDDLDGGLFASPPSDSSDGVRSTRPRITEGETSPRASSAGPSFLELLASSDTDFPTSLKSPQR